MRKHKMENILNMIKAGSATLGGLLAMFLGGYDGFIYALVAFVLIDYILGVACAVADKVVSSQIGFRGIAKKVTIFALVGVGNIIDVHVIGSGNVIRTAVIFFYLSNEGISLLENSAYLGLPIPEKLRDILLQLREESE